MQDLELLFLCCMSSVSLRISCEFCSWFQPSCDSSVTGGEMIEWEVSFRRLQLPNPSVCLESPLSPLGLRWSLRAALPWSGLARAGQWGIPGCFKFQTLPTGAVLEAAKAPSCAQVLSQLLKVVSDVMLLFQNNSSHTCPSTGFARGTKWCSTGGRSWGRWGHLVQSSLGGVKFATLHLLSLAQVLQPIKSHWDFVGVSELLQCWLDCWWSSSSFSFLFEMRIAINQWVSNSCRELIIV